MQTSTHDDRTLTELDHVRLTKLTAASPAADQAVEATLDGAELVSPQQVAPDVVTMYSQVLLTDVRSGSESEITLCYPADADPAAGRVSVLSPVGASLLGLRVGAIARWRTPAGEEGAARVTKLLFQPEASGDYTR